MRLGTFVNYAGGFDEFVDEVAAHEQNGLDIVAIPEAYSFDAVSQLGYLAARTSRLELMSAILPLYTRTPTLIAMTAAGIDYVSGGRFTLGLGASGPQVIEGFHGVRYDAPLGRTREVVEVVRTVWRREVLSHRGAHYRIPFAKEDGGSGLGKPLKLINRPVRPAIPISIAALGPANVELVAEIADGWQPLFFHPAKASAVWGEALRAGSARRAPALGPLDVQVQIPFLFGECEPTHLEQVRQQIALYVGGMGAPGKNFYNQLATRYGYADEAREIQRLYLAGQKREAADLVPHDLVDAITLIGDADEVRSRVERLRAAGVTTLLTTALADDPARRVSDLAHLAQILRELDAESQGPEPDRR